MSDVLPVTQQQITQTEIEYSVKVGKQVIIEQLTTIKADLKKEASVLLAQIQLTNDAKDIVRAKYRRALDNKLIHVVNNCSSANKIRLFVNTFTSANFRSNWDIVIHSTVGSVVRTLIEPLNPGFSRGNERYDRMSYVIDATSQKILDNGAAEVEYTTCVSVPSKKSIQAMRDDEFEYSLDNNENNTWETEIRIPDEILAELKARIDVIKQLQDIQNRYNDLADKLENIDKTMEKMEASLLVNELKRTTRGMEVMNIASGIISDILGNTPQLLTLNNKSPD